MNNDEPVGVTLWEGEPIVVTKKGKAYRFDSRKGKWRSIPSVPRTPAQRKEEGRLP